MTPWWNLQMLAGQVAICDQIKFELLHSTRNAREYERLKEDLDALPSVPIGRSEWGRALEVHELLGKSRPGAYHRSVKPADLLIAAAAESAGLALVHYDRDFDAIQGITSQPMRWVVRRGTID